jgi:hypothetical protein
MIDTLKLSKRLTAAHMPPEQAEAISEGLAESLKDSYVTKNDLRVLEQNLKLWFGGLMTAGLTILFTALHYWPPK